MPQELETDSFFAIGSLLRPLVLHDHLQTGNNLLKDNVHFGDGIVDDFFVPKIERERKIDKVVLKYDLYYSKL